MTFLRSLAFAIIFYSWTVVAVLLSFPVSLLGTPAIRAWAHGWARFHRWCAAFLLGIRTRVEGEPPDGAVLVAAKHQSMFETIEMVRISDLPVIVIKRELADMPLFGFMTRRYGVIAVERSAGAKALRALVEEGKRAVATGRSVIIYPEGTRVRVGETPALKSGFAALYRALGLPVVPVAVDSGRLWGRGLVHCPGTITLLVGDVIPPGLKRDEIEGRVHAAINRLELAPQARA